MGERVFNKFQWGKEATKGTAVAADTMMLADPMPIRPDRKPRRPEDATGIRSRSLRAVFDEYLVQDTLKISNGYYEILPMLFSCGLMGDVTATEVTAGQGDYLWTHTPSLTGAITLDSITMEVGDDVQAYECEYMLFDRYKISGQIDQGGGDSAISIEAGFFARQWTATTFTGGLSLPTTELMNAKLAQFYLDTAWAGVGGTEKTGLLRAFDIEILTGVKPIFTGSGYRYFHTYGQGEISVMAAFTFEGNSDADAIWDLMNSQALSVARLKISGATIGSGTAHSLTVDIGGTWEDVIPIASEDRGNNLHTAVLQGKYDATGAKLLQVAVVADVSAI